MLAGKRIPVESLAALLTLALTMPLAGQNSLTPALDDAAKATFDIQLPTDAKLEIAGHPMPSTGVLRRFQVPLPAGQNELTYTLKATWKGKSVSREFTIRAGRIAVVDLRGEFDDKAGTPGTFSLLAVAPVVVLPGESKEMIVRIKRDRNHDPVVIAFKKLPAGITVNDSVIAPDKDAVTVTLQAAPDVKWSAGNAQIEAEAGDVRRTQPLLLSVGQIIRSLNITLPDRVYVVAGSKTEAKVTIKRAHVDGEIQVTFQDLPAGVEIKPIVIPEGETEGRFLIESTRAAHVGAASVRVFARSGPTGAQAKFAVLVGEPRGEVARANGASQPAAKVQIPRIPTVPPADKQEVRASGDLAVKAGQVQLVSLTIDRKGYQGPLTLKLVGLPESVSAPAINLPAGRESARILVLVEDSAEAANCTLRLIATGNNDFKSETEVPLRIIRDTR